MILNLLPFLVTTFAGGTEPTGTSIQSVFDPSLPITMQATLQGEDGRDMDIGLASSLGPSGQLPSSRTTT